MAVLWVREVVDRTARRDTERSALAREFKALTDSVSDGAWTVRLDPGVPRIYDQHPENTLARVREVEAAPDQNYKLLWRIRVNYQTGLAAAPSDNPLDKPRIRSWSFVPITEVFEKTYDTSGNLTIPYQGSNFMPFVPALEEESHLALLTVQRNEATYNAALALAYQDTVNSDPFYGAPPGTAKFFGGGAVEVPDGPFTYWQATYQILFNKNGFKRVVADRGTYEFVNPPGRHIPIMGKDTNGKPTNRPITEPVYLNGSGRILPTGSPIVYFEFSVNKAVPFGPLNLE